MNQKRDGFFPQFVGLLLSISLGLPNPALAMRGESAAQTKTTSGLEKALQSGPEATARKLAGVAQSFLNPAAASSGLEEGKVWSISRRDFLRRSAAATVVIPPWLEQVAQGQESKGPVGALVPLREGLGKEKQLGIIIWDPKDLLRLQDFFPLAVKAGIDTVWISGYRFRQLTDDQRKKIVKQASNVGLKTLGFIDGNHDWAEQRKFVQGHYQVLIEMLSDLDPGKMDYAFATDVESYSKGNQKGYMDLIEQIILPEIRELASTKRHKDGTPVVKGSLLTRFEPWWFENGHKTDRNVTITGLRAVKDTAIAAMTYQNTGPTIAGVSKIVRKRAKSERVPFQFGVETIPSAEAGTPSFAGKEVRIGPALLAAFNAMKEDKGLIAGVYIHTRGPVQAHGILEAIARAKAEAPEKPEGPIQAASEFGVRGGKTDTFTASEISLQLLLPKDLIKEKLIAVPLVRAGSEWYPQPYADDRALHLVTAGGRVTVGTVPERSPFKGGRARVVLIMKESQGPEFLRKYKKAGEGNVRTAIREALKIIEIDDDGKAKVVDKLPRAGLEEESYGLNSAQLAGLKYLLHIAPTENLPPLSQVIEQLDSLIRTQPEELSAPEKALIESLLPKLKDERSRRYLDHLASTADQGAPSQIPLPTPAVPVVSAATRGQVPASSTPPVSSSKESRVNKFVTGAALFTAGAVAGGAGVATYNKLTAPNVQPSAQVAPLVPGPVQPEQPPLAKPEQPGTPLVFETLRRSEVETPFGKIRVEVSEDGDRLRAILPERFAGPNKRARSYIFWGGYWEGPQPLPRADRGQFDREGISPTEGITFIAPKTADGMFYRWWHKGDSLVFIGDPEAIKVVDRSPNAVRDLLTKVPPGIDFILRIRDGGKDAEILYSPHLPRPAVAPEVLAEQPKIDISGIEVSAHNMEVTFPPELRGNQAALISEVGINRAVPDMEQHPSVFIPEDGKIQLNTRKDSRHDLRTADARIIIVSGVAKPKTTMMLLEVGKPDADGKSKAWTYNDKRPSEKVRVTPAQPKGGLEEVGTRIGLPITAKFSELEILIQQPVGDQPYEVVVTRRGMNPRFIESSSVNYSLSGGVQAIRRPVSQEQYTIPTGITSIDQAKMALQAIRTEAQIKLGNGDWNYFSDGQYLGFVQRIREQYSAGLEEGVQVRTVEDLSTVAPELAAEVQSAGKTHVALLPVDAVGTKPESSAIDLYAHPSVSGGAMAILPESWRIEHILPISPDNPENASTLLQQAADALAQGRTVAIAIDASIQEGIRLPKNHPVVLLLNPATWDKVDRAVLAAYLAKPNALLNLILDLTAGSIRRVTIQGRDYYAIFV